MERFLTEVEDLLSVIEDVCTTALMGNPQRVPLFQVNRLVEVL